MPQGTKLSSQCMLPCRHNKWSTYMAVSVFYIYLSFSVYAVLSVWYNIMCHAICKSSWSESSSMLMMICLHACASNIASNVYYGILSYGMTCQTFFDQKMHHRCIFTDGCCIRQARLPSLACIWRMNRNSCSVHCLRMQEFQTSDNRQQQTATTAINMQIDNNNNNTI